MTRLFPPLPFPKPPAEVVPGDRMNLVRRSVTGLRRPFTWPKAPETEDWARYRWHNFDPFNAVWSMLSQQQRVAFICNIADCEYCGASEGVICHRASKVGIPPYDLLAHPPSPIDGSGIHQQRLNKAKELAEKIPRNVIPASYFWYVHNHTGESPELYDLFYKLVTEK